MNTAVRIVAAVAFLLGSMPVSSAAQSEKRPESKPAEKSARDHLKAAQAALGEVEVDALTPEAGVKVKDLKQRFAALARDYDAHGKKSMSQQETPSGSTRVRIGHEGTWSTHVPDIDKLLGELIASQSPLTRHADRTDAVKRKLTDVRTHLTAFAKGATGTSGAPK